MSLINSLQPPRNDFSCYGLIKVIQKYFSHLYFIIIKGKKIVFSLILQGFVSVRLGINLIDEKQTSQINSPLVYPDLLEIKINAVI